MNPRNFIRASAFVALLMAASSAECAVRAWVDDSAAGDDGSIELILEHDGQTDSQPDLAPLRQDFDVLGSERSSSIQIVNGSSTSSVRVAVSLSPKHGGVQTIPALTWGNEKSDPVTIKASSAAGNSATAPGGASIFLKTRIDPQRSYVQAAVDLTVRLYAAVPLSQAQLELPANNDVLVQQVGSDKNETVVENGRRYQVFERHYALFPQRSGSLSLPGPVLEGRVAVQTRDDVFGDAFKDFFGHSPFSGLTSSKPVRVRGEDIALTVLPRPAAAAGNAYWLPARHVSLDAEWHPSGGHLKAGDPVTLDLHLKAQGLTAAQLPDLSAMLQLPDGIKAYPDQATLKNEANGNGTQLSGERDQSIALIADHAGEFTVPALSVQWWDTDANIPRVATLPARTLSFTAGAPASMPPAPAANAAMPSQPAERAAAAPSPVLGSAPTSQPTPQPWFWSSVILGVLWLMTLIAWFVSRRGSSAPAATPVNDQRDASAAEARRAFREACKRNDAREARSALKEWIRCASPANTLVNLHAFARDAGDPNLKGLLLELDRACYSRSPWQGIKLMEALQELPSARKAQQRSADSLVSLYK